MILALECLGGNVIILGWLLSKKISSYYNENNNNNIIQQSFCEMEIHLQICGTKWLLSCLYYLYIIMINNCVITMCIPILQMRKMEEQKFKQISLYQITSKL